VVRFNRPSILPNKAMGKEEGILASKIVPIIILIVTGRKYRIWMTSLWRTKPTSRAAC
jgi:hypothetical protein